MKRFSILPLASIIVMAVSACGAKAAPQPTVDVAAIQLTSASVALTMIAYTQAAIPSVTPVPPTATFTATASPTSTFLPPPVAGVTSTPGPNGSAGGENDCINKRMPDLLQGETIKVRLNNTTKSALTISVNLNQTATQHQCGYRTYSAAAGQPVVINDLIVGCYSIWAWNPDPKGYFIVTNGTNCLDTSYKWVFDISTSKIELR